MARIDIELPDDVLTRDGDRARELGFASLEAYYAARLSLDDPELAPNGWGESPEIEALLERRMKGDFVPCTDELVEDIKQKFLETRRSKTA